MSARPLPLRERLRAFAAAGATAGGSERPLLLGPSPIDVLPGGASALIDALRKAADSVIGIQRRIVEAGADLLVAPTAGTTAPSLHQSGQAYRAAALTAAAVDLTRDAAFAARTGAAVIGEVVASPSARGRSEARTHVERLATSAIDGVLVWGDDPEGLLDVVRAAAAHGLPTLVQISVARASDDPIGDLERAGVLGALVGVEGSAPVVVIVASSALDVMCDALSRLRVRHPRLPLGARLAIDAPVGPIAAIAAKHGESVQLAAAAAWGALAPFALAVIGFGGPTALGVLPVLADLASAERATLLEVAVKSPPGSPTSDPLRGSK